MARGKELSPGDRDRICELSSIHFTPSRIHKLHPEWPLSTIKYTIRREAARVKNESLSRSGRPRALTDEQRDYVYDITNHINPHIKMRNLLNEVDNDCKKRSLQYLLREMNKRKWRQRNRPKITQAYADARLAWAIRHQHYTIIDWHRVTWSDECTIERGVGVRPVWTFVRLCDQILHRDVHPIRATGKGVKKMLWAAFGSNRRTGLVPFDGDPESPRQGVSSWVIRALYQAFLPDIMVENGEFMHDGAGPHRGHIVIDILRQMNIKVMIWPAYSPDLNPIENLWALVKAEIYKLHPELENAPDNEETLELLVNAAKEAWHAIDMGILHRLAMTMNNRVEAVIEAEGWYTKY